MQYIQMHELLQNKSQTESQQAAQTIEIQLGVEKVLFQFLCYLAHPHRKKVNFNQIVKMEP